MALGKYAICAGLGGSFGGAKFDRVEEFDTDDEADEAAWETACEIYERYVGLYGLRTVSEIMEEDGLNEKEAEERYINERESWLEYYAKRVDDDTDLGDIDA